MTSNIGSDIVRKGAGLGFAGHRRRRTTPRCASRCWRPPSTASGPSC
jgi:hypothetical protein